MLHSYKFARTRIKNKTHLLDVASSLENELIFSYILELPRSIECTPYIAGMPNNMELLHLQCSHVPQQGEKSLKLLVLPRSILALVKVFSSARHDF